MKAAPLRAVMIHGARREDGYTMVSNGGAREAARDRRSKVDYTLYCDIYSLHRRKPIPWFGLRPVNLWVNARLR